MKYFFAILVLFLGQAQGQTIRDYIEENIFQIQTVSPDAVATDDLEELAKAMGNADIILPGEQDHGDAAIFLAK